MSRTSPLEWIQARPMQDELRAVAEGLAARLHRAVAMDDPHLRLLVHTSHDKNVDEHRVHSVLCRQSPPDLVEHVFSHGIAAAPGPVRIPGSPDRRMLGRVCVPMRCDTRLFGYLWLIDDGEPVTGDELRLAVEAAAAAGQLLHRQRLTGDLRESRGQVLLCDLVSDDPSVRAHAAAELARADTVPADGEVVVVGVRVGEAALAGVAGAATELDFALQRAVRHVTPVPALAMTRSGGHGTLLLAGTKLPSRQALCSQVQDLRSSLAKALGSDEVRVGVGPTVRGLLAAHRSHAGAQDVLRVTEVVSGFGPVVWYDELGIYRLLVHLPLEELPVDAIPTGLRTLIDGDGDGPLVETLETYLDEAGDARASVARLHVHRCSLYYRRSRIEEITGMSLSNGGDRLALHLGLKLARLLGLLANP